MAFMLRDLPVTWSHVDMLIHQCRDHSMMARIAAQGIQNSLIYSIRRKAIQGEDGKVIFGMPVTIVAEPEEGRISAGPGQQTVEGRAAAPMFRDAWKTILVGWIRRVTRIKAS